MIEIEKIFKFDDRGYVRTVTKDGEPWFVANDVCAVINIRDIGQALERLCDDERGVYSIPTPGGVQTMVIVSEPGLYKLILRSRAATTPGTTAYKFCRWVTHEVLPSIRRTGSYSIPERLAHETIDLDNKAAYARMAAEIQVAWAVRYGLRFPGR